MSSDSASKIPVFLHGMWRSGSTYIWSCFRELESSYCYYEPLNQGLGRLTKDRIGRDTPEIVAGNRHPALSQPYFAEFEPLLKKRGVRGFTPGFAYLNYALRAEDKDPRLQNYIAGLIDYAARQNKQPVLGFNRTGLRMAWLAKHFPSYNIHIDRNPRDIWASYQQQKEEGNYTYFTAWLLTLEKNTHQDFLKPLTDMLPLRRPVQIFLNKPKPYYREVLDRLGPADTYYMVFYVWLCCILHGLSHCDMVIDMDRMDDADYRKSRSDLIAQSCGLAPDFSDARAVARAGDDIEFAEIEQAVIRDFPHDSFAGFIEPLRAKNKLSSLAAHKAQMLAGFFT